MVSTPRKGRRKGIREKERHIKTCVSETASGGGPLAQKSSLLTSGPVVLWGLLGHLLRMSVVMGVRLRLIERLIMARADVSEATHSVTLLCLYLLIDQPESVDMARKIAQNREEDVDEKVTTTARDDERCSWWKDDSDDDEDYVG